MPVMADLSMQILLVNEGLHCTNFI